MSIGRPQAPIHLEDAEKEYLLTIKDEPETPEEIRNAAIILLEGEKNTPLSILHKEFKIPKKRIGAVRRAFLDEGIQCLNYGEYLHPQGLSISDNPAWNFNEEIVKNVIYYTQNVAPPDGQSRWSSRSLGDKLGISRTMVCGIWNEYGVKPENQSISVDPEQLKEWEEVLSSDLYSARDKQRVRIVRMYCQGFQKEEIASTLRISKNTVRNWVGRFQKGEPLYKKKGLVAPIDPEKQKEWAEVLNSPAYPSNVKTRIQIIQMHAQGKSNQEIMATLKACRSTVQNWIRDYKAGKPLY